MAPGDAVSLHGYEFRFESLTERPGPNFKAEEARFTIWQDGKSLGELRPQKRIYTVRSMPMTEAGIAPGLRGDLYVSLGEPLDGKAWSVRVSYKAWVRLVWLGALMMAAGGLLGLGDRRYRQPAEASVPAGSALGQS